VLVDRFVEGQQVCTGAYRVTNDEAVEGVARPRQRQRGVNDLVDRVVIDLDSKGVTQKRELVLPGLRQPAQLDQALQLEDDERRDAKVLRVEQCLKSTQPSISAGKPRCNVGVEVNHTIGFQYGDQSKCVSSSGSPRMMSRGFGQRIVRRFFLGRAARLRTKVSPLRTISTGRPVRAI
jgi:hypothetical protein